MAGNRGKRRSRNDHPADLQTAESYVGREVEKLFPDGNTVKPFRGSVISVDEHAEEDGTIIPNSFIYSIRYEDGDEEGLTWSELLDVLMEPDDDQSQEEADSGDKGQQKKRKKAKQATHALEHEPEDGEAMQSDDPVHASDRVPLRSIPLDVKVRQKGSPGHLYKIKLENFMCHENFEMEFGMHVNVVSGSNGSGKSAVMQALQCCLGARAKATGRSTSLGGFVRTGAHEARVQVTLWNTGPEAYLPDVYGEQITVERRIKAEGAGGGFKLIAANGKKISERRDELDAMLDALTLDATNPLTVLTQDTARNFLAGAVAEKKKYELFMEGTLLQEVKDNVYQADAYCKQMTGYVNKQKLEFKAKATELRKLDDRLLQLQDIEKCRAQHAELYNAVAWRVVHLHEAQAAECQARLARLPGLVEEKQAMLGEARRRLQNKIEEEKRLAEEMEHKMRDSQATVAQRQRLLEERRKLISQHRALEREEREMRAELANMQQERQGLQEVLERDREQADVKKQARLEAVQATAAQMDEVREKRERLNAQLQECRLKCEEAEGRIAAVKEEYEMVEGRKTEAESELRRLQEQHQNLEDAARNKLAAFGGTPVVRLDEAIQRNAHRFKRLPVGPLGRFLTLRDPRWGKVMESVIGFLCNQFVVSCEADRKELESLARSVNYPPRELRCIVKTNMGDALYSIPQQQMPHPHLVTVLRVLNSNCEDDVTRNTVLNTLIDRASIERVVLVETREAGQQLLYDNSGANHNVQTIWDLECTQYKDYGNRTKAIIPSRENRHTNVRLGGDAAQQAGSLMEAIEQQQETVRQLQSELDRLRQASNQLHQEWQQLERAKTAVGQQGRLAGQQMTQLTSTLASQQQEAADEGGTDSALGQLTELTAGIAQLQADIDRVVGDVAAALQRKEASEQEVEQFEVTVRQIVAEKEQAQAQLAEMARAKAAAQKVLADGEAVMAMQQAELSSCQQKLHQALVTVEGATAEATQVCSREAGEAALANVRAQIEEEVIANLEARWARIPGSMEREVQNQGHIEQLVKHNADLKMNETELIKMLQKLEKQIKDAETSAGGNRDELQLQHDLAKAELTKLKKVLDEVVKCNEKLQNDIKIRISDYNKCFTAVSDTVDLRFNTYMAKRGHLGKVKIDSEEGKLVLSIKIHGRTNTSVKAINDLKQLSGGERSFSTVAFLLALGEHTEGPFRCMDEFDVFMDAVNRRISTATLLEFAMDHSDVQFILLTPQDLQAVEDAKQQVEKSKKLQLPDGFLKVVVMRPARTGNAARA